MDVKYDQPAETVDDWTTEIDDCAAGMDDNQIEEKVDRYNQVISNFVALYANRARQRTDDWLAKKQISVGGSEIAALMGWNRYSSPEDTVASKAGIISRGLGSIACWWGSMFEAVIERYVEIDCGTRLFGTDISIPAPPSSGLEYLHANSPDGFAVLTLYMDAKADWRILRTDAETLAAAKSRPKKPVIVLLEFKCPYRRRPNGSIPKHYRPQVWSGLAVSPIAHFGVYIDAGFRKCALQDLGPSINYDRAYHQETPNPSWTTPIAWGITGVYEPYDETQKRCQNVDTDDFDDFCGYFYHNPGDDMADGVRRIRFTEHRHPALVDFGNCEPGSFETMMSLLDRKYLRAVHVGPCFPDGRGIPLRTEHETEAAVQHLKDNPPPHHTLFGVIPWKLYEVDYIFLERYPDFLEMIAPKVRECLDQASQIRVAEDPVEAFNSYRISKSLKNSTPPVVLSIETIDELQSLSDSMMSATPAPRCG